MAGTRDNYQLLIQKLDEFIRKFYINKLIRGALYSIGLILILFLAVSTLEHFFYFSTGVRKLLFFSFVGVSVVALSAWILLPLMNYFRLGKVISHEQAATIIGDHFGNVKDKLLNILQLKQQTQGHQHADLINASINQKTAELQPVPFKKAINLNQNRKYLRYALPPLLLLLVLIIAAPSMIKDSTARLINNGEVYERPAPFAFEVVNQDLSVVQFEDYELEVKVDGDILPNEAYIDINNYRYKMTKTSPTTFSYKFSKVAENKKFYLTASGFDSRDYQLKTLKKPNILGFDIKLDYPNYTGRKDEVLSNIGDMVVPVGTRIKWSFMSQNTEEVALQFSNKKDRTVADRVGDGLFETSKKQLRDEAYMVYISNEFLKDADSVAYTLSVIPDATPTISVEQFIDSAENKLLYFAGDASDDYGIFKLNFNYTIEGEGKPKALQTLPILSNPGKATQYEYTWDLFELGLKPGDKLTYYFEVFDNDGINGSKSARTGLMSYAVPTVEEYKEMASQNNSEIKEDLEKAMKEAAELQKEVKDLKEKLLQKKEIDWQDRKDIENLLERQKKLEKQIEEAKKNFQENLDNQQEFEETKEEIVEKQEQLQKLFDEVMSEELKELMKKMEELLQEMNKDQMMEDLENFEMNDDELEKELDRMLELFKQLEFEHEMEQTIDELEELAKEQEELSEETKEGETSKEELEKKQEELNEKFDKVQEKLEDLEKKNEELQSPTDMDGMQEQSEQIEQDQQNSSEQLKQDQQQKASESQKKASEKMKNLANSMQMQMQSAQMQQMQEDMESLRQLLENLVNLSFDQEALMEDIRLTQVNTPAFVEKVQEQYKLKDDFTLIEDSLQALSKRVFQIESFVTEKVTGIKKDFKVSLDELEERRKSPAAIRQQRIMTGVNDLALMLSEVMEQMQQQMAGQMAGSQQCQKPNQKGQGQQLQKMGQMQDQLNKQMQQMKEGMKNGKGGKKWSKEFAEMAAKQAAIRKAMRELQKQKQGEGKGSKELEELMKEMDKVETDLVNKRLTNEMLKRQEEILTRLLEAEKAEREREFDNKREAETAQNKERKRPPALEEYLKQREAEIDAYRQVSPALKPYYKSLVEEYYKTLKGNK